MIRRFSFSRSSAALSIALAAIAATVGMQCPPDEGAPLNPPVTTGNRAPRLFITAVTTPSANFTVEQGQLVTIDFTGEDSEDRAIVRIFASTSTNPTIDQEISILASFPVGPGTGNGRAFWRTNNIVPGSYFVFGEITDGTYNPETDTGNRPVRTSFTSPVLVVPEGIGDENGAPTLAIDLPATDAGLSNNDILTVRYTVLDPDSDADTLSVRVLFDRDRNSANDATDPPLEVATRTIPSGTLPPGTPGLFQEDITIDLNTIPIRLETDEGRRPLPYNIRVEVSDGSGHIVNQYAVGALRLLRAPVDVVDTINVGSTIAGATWQGFDGNPVNPAGGSRAGSYFAAPGDLDGDGLADFYIAAETASPFNAPNVGEVYLIYGRQRRIPPDFQAVLGFGSGRYSGVLSLNTVGSYVPFPPSDPRFQRYFNIRGTIIPQQPNVGGQTSGISSLAILPDVTGDGRPELLVGVPRTRQTFDQEDYDPCDECSFEEEVFAPIICLDGVQTRIGDNSLSAEVEGIETVLGGQWAPINPVGLAPGFPPNVTLDETDGRITRILSFVMVLSGERTDEMGTPFTVRIQLENENGPFQEFTVNPDGEGAFDNTIVVFPLNLNNDPAHPGFANFPQIEGQGIPPSVFDGQFLVFVRPSVTVDFETIEVRIGAVVTTAEREHPIRFSYFDGFPGRISGNPGCAQADPVPVSPFALGEFSPVCPPRNRTSFPLATPGFGNRDGHLCTDAQFTAGLAGGGGVVNDNMHETPYESGIVFINASTDLVQTISNGLDTDGDGVPDNGPYGFHQGDGYRVALQRFFGQPPYIRQGGLGMIGARFRGAWYQPTGVYDPFSRFGHTVATMPDIDTFGIGVATSELLISAPDGGTPAFLPPIDLTAQLAGVYDHNPANPNTREFASAPFNFNRPFTSVLSATVQVTGSATNVPKLRVGLAGGNGRPLAPAGGVNRSRDVLLWGGAGAPPAADELPTLEYDEFYGDTVNFSINAQLPEAALTLLLSGQGNLALEILPDCASAPTSINVTSVELFVTALVQTGYIVMINGDDYTCSECTGLENARCIPNPDNDPEGGENRPMSWPSMACDTTVNPPVRQYCYHGEVGNFAGERIFDAFGFAQHAGDLNLDGVADFVCGAPGSSNDPFMPDLFCGDEPNPLTRNGKVYVIYGTPTLGSGRPCDIPERFEIRGTHNDDQFGRTQGNAGDMDGDGNDDLFFAAEGYNALGDDFNNDGQPDVPSIGNDAGFVGILFGRTYGNATRSIRCEQVGTANFPGVKFIGGVAGARLGGGQKSFDADANVYSAGQRGQQGVASAGDFNLDGFQDLLITAPGQPWPAAKIEFEGPVADGEIVSVNGIQFEFDTNNSFQAGRVRVELTATDALTAQRALIEAMNKQNAETLGVGSLQSQNQFPAPLPDTPTINFLRRTYTPFSNWVTATGPGGGATSIKVTESVRQGVAYLVFGDPTLLSNKTFLLPQDLNRRNSSGTRVLRGIVFVSGYEKDSGPNDPTPDEAPITAVLGLGDVDGDGFVDIILGAPEADFINIIAPNERRQASGEAYLIYGNNFGLNAKATP